jgi:phage shock protein A
MDKIRILPFTEAPAGYVVASEQDIRETTARLRELESAIAEQSFRASKLEVLAELDRLRKPPVPDILTFNAFMAEIRRLTSDKAELSAHIDRVYDRLAYLDDEVRALRRKLAGVN